MKFFDLEKRAEVLSLRNLFLTTIDESKSTEDKTTKVQIYISPDRTKLQREEHKKLVAEMKARKKNGEKDIGIRDRKIVNIEPFRPNPQSYWGCEQKRTECEGSTQKTAEEQPKIEQ